MKEIVDSLSSQPTKKGNNPTAMLIANTTEKRRIMGGNKGRMIVQTTAS